MSDVESSVSPAATKAITKIILAAEAEFSLKGFDGAGMKAIATRADVSQGLLHYHFGTKDHLYSEVIKHRSERINGEREALLDQVDLTRADALDKIFEALFRPPLGPSGGDITYARIFSRLVVGHDREQALVQEFYDPTAQKFIAALKVAIPGADQAVAASCYSLSLGALISMIGRDGRVERLMGRDQAQDIEEILQQLVLFAKGGAMMLAQSK